MSEDFMKIDNDEDGDVRLKGAGKIGASKSRWKSLILLGLAIILIFALVNKQIFARSSALTGGWYTAGACCGGGDGSGERAALSSCCSGGGEIYTEEQLAQAGLDYYSINFGDEDVEAVVEDFGCHQEIAITRNGEIVRRFSFVNGTINDITR